MLIAKLRMFSFFLPVTLPLFLKLYGQILWTCPSIKTKEQPANVLGKGSGRSLEENFQEMMPKSPKIVQYWVEYI